MLGFGKICIQKSIHKNVELTMGQKAKVIQVHKFSRLKATSVIAKTSEKIGFCTHLNNFYNMKRSENHFGAKKNFPTESRFCRYGYPQSG